MKPFGAVQADLTTYKQAAGLTPRETADLGSRVLPEFASTLLADNALSEWEEREFFSLAGLLGVDVGEQLPAVLENLMIGRVNTGELPVVPEPALLLREHEVVHWQEWAELMKEIAQREWQSGSSGFSFRVMKGVHYRIGSSRGRMVTVGTSLQPVDSALLCVTSRRITFLGQKSTIEILYSRLVNIEVFADGLRIHVSNRKTPLLFRLKRSQFIAALINEAFQRT